MSLQTKASRIQVIGATSQDQAVEFLQQLLEIVILGHWGNQHGETTTGCNTVVVTGIEPTQCTCILFGRSKITVDSNPRFSTHQSGSFLVPCTSLCTDIHSPRPACRAGWPSSTRDPSWTARGFYRHARQKDDRTPATEGDADNPPTGSQHVTSDISTAHAAWR